MRYLHCSRDVLIFTDAHRVAGCVIDDSRQPKGHPVTSGFIRLLEDVLLDPQRTKTPSFDELRVAGLESGEEPWDLSGLGAFLDTSPSIGWRSAPQPLGRTSTQEFTEDQVVALDGNPVWCPAGVVATRNIGETTFHFAVSPMDLRGSVQVDPLVLASPVSAAGPQLRLVAGAECGMCSMCGVCALCAEINAATPAGNISAIAVLGQFQDAPSPADRRALIEATYRREYAGEHHARRIPAARRPTARM